MEGLDFEIPAGVHMPKGHESMDPKDFAKCPFSKSGGKPPMADKPKTKPADKDKDKQKDSDSEEEQPTGGCPVMTNGMK